MKILILGEEKGLFGKNLATWLRNAGHTCEVWEKFYPTGNPNNCAPSPISSPDIVLNLRSFVMYEDLEMMGITNKPKRIFYNLGNKNVSLMTNDWRVHMFTDHFLSYNPMHKNYQINETSDRFANLKCLPLPFDYSKIEHQDFSQSELQVCQTLSGIAMAGAYTKHTYSIGNACKLNGVPFNIIHGLSPNGAIAKKRTSPVLFDSLGGMFGVTTLEAWSIGQAVICNIEQPILDEYAEILGAPPPHINATSHADLITVMGKIASGEIDWKAKCLESRAYMENYYNPTKIAQAYINYFESIL